MFYLLPILIKALSLQKLTQVCPMSTGTQLIDFQDRSYNKPWGRGSQWDHTRRQTLTPHKDEMA